MGKEGRREEFLVSATPGNKQSRRPALLFRKHHHLCRQEVASADSQQLQAQFRCLSDDAVPRGEPDTTDGERGKGEGNSDGGGGRNEDDNMNGHDGSDRGGNGNGNDI